MPLMGAQGPGSNISWRGNLDEYPDFFGFVDLSNQMPGAAVTSNSQTITGINYKALVTAVGSGCSVSVNGGEYRNGNDNNNPIIIRNNDTVSLQIRTIQNGDRFDFNRSYNVNVRIGKRDAAWLVRTRELDDDPIPFNFTDSLNNEVSVGRTSNEVQVLDIDDTIGVDALITTPTGTLYINGVNSGTSGKVFNGDYIYLGNTSSGFYNTNVVTTVTLGTYTTSYNIRTRVADATVNAFVFNPLTDVNINSIHDSNTITLSGADPNVNGNNLLPTTITGGQFRVVRDGITVRDFSSSSFQTQNGDQITVRIVASPNYSTKATATLNVNGVVGSFEVTTRPAPVKTFPSPFNFVDRTGVERTATLTPPENRIDSAPITLSGMTEATNDFGTATITGTGGDGSAAQFKVVRNNQTVRDFGTASAQVRNGDQIFLRIISSPNSLGQVSATFTVSGTDTNTVVAGVPGSTSDTWFVRSAERFCNITTFTLEEQREAIPGQTYSRSFVAAGFDKDCGCTVSTSDTTNSYLKVGTRTGTSLTVSLGETVEIYMVAPYYDSTRSTTVTLASSYGTSRQAIYRIVPAAPPLPELTLDANPRNAPFIFPDGGSTTISYTYDYVTNASVTTNFGVSTVTTPKGSGSRSVTNILTTTTYTMTVSNSTGSTTRSVQVTVGDPPTPTASLCPSDTSTCSSSSSIPYGGNITLFWKTQFATSITSNDFSTGNQQNGSVTLSNLTADNRTYTITATGPGGTVNASHTVNLTPSVNLTADSENIINGQSTTLRWTSFLATSVVSASGFDAGGQVSGSLSVTPTTTTTYSITVSDAEGNQISDSVRVNVTDDRTPDSFRFEPPSFTGQQLNANVVSEPVFTNGGSSVSGLSPGVSVTATVSGTGAQFESGGTSKTVQNGTSTSSLRVRLTNASTFGTTRTASLNVGGVSASFTSRTLDCTVRNGSGSVDGAITVNTRDTQSSGFLATGLSGGGGTISRGGGTSFDQTYGQGNSSLTLPAGTNRFYAAVIGGGGGGASDQGCGSDAAHGAGGGGAAWGEVTGNFGGQTVSISVGSGGNNSQGESRAGKGGDTVVTMGGRTWKGEGGQGSAESSPGDGGSNNSSPTGQTSRGSRGNDTSGSGGKRGGGGGGAGQINGGQSSNGANGCDSGPASGGNGGRGGSITGGSGDAGENGVCRNNNECGNRQGGRGGNFGGGGGGGAQGASGGNGAPGRARITYSVPAPPTETYFNLCREIMRAYWDKLNRAPSVSEIQTWVNNFKNNPTTYPNASSIYNAINGTRFSGTLLDNCGQTFPRFP